jgi:hypothetical protein
MGPGGPGTPQSTASTSTLPGVGVTPPPLGGPPLTHIPPGAGPPQFRALIPPFVSFIMFPIIVKNETSAEL